MEFAIEPEVLDVGGSPSRLLDDNFPLEGELFEVGLQSQVVMQGPDIGRQNLSCLGHHRCSRAVCTVSAHVPLV